MHNYKYSASLSELVKHGLLLVRDVGKISSWWFTIPGISLFKTDFTKGNVLHQLTMCLYNNII